MSTIALLPDPRCLRLDCLLADTDTVTILMTGAQAKASCPNCATVSSRVHSRYRRTLTDLPWQGSPVRLLLTVRRFFCVSPSCTRVVFAERLPTVAAPYARTTVRTEELLRALGFALGGEPGSRLAERLAVPVSPDTLLRRVRRAPQPARATPRMLGVDDFAFRRGQRYGTILVDLEQHIPIEILDDRLAETFATWLAEHPGVEVVSRDRAQAYAQGARQGAPNAVQVADRFHLLKNLTDAVEAILGAQHAVLRQVARAADVRPADAEPQTNLQTGSVLPSPVDASEDAPTSQLSPLTQLGEEPTIDSVERTWRAHQDGKKAASRERRLRRYTDVVELDARGCGRREIARRTGLSRNTVKRYLAAGTFPERADSPRPSAVDRFLPYLKERWESGCHNAEHLWRELRTLGYRGGQTRVRDKVAPWREPGSRSRRPKRSRDRAAQPVVLSPRQAMWLIVRDEDEVESKKHALRSKLLELCPVAASASALALEFIAMVRGRNAERLEPWLNAAKGSGLAEFASFARGIEQDKAAVLAALTTEVSNGQVEGQVNRLKVIKRQMYGRAKLDLLRARVLNGSG